jgi:hypothetical protein
VNPQVPVKEMNPVPVILSTMRLRRPEMRRMLLPILQIFTGVLTALASVFEWSVWWPFVIPWMVLNIPGIVLAIPVIAGAFLAAGVAHFDWRSESFFVGSFIAAPTILSLIACPILAAWRRKAVSPARPGTFGAAPRRLAPAPLPAAAPVPAEPPEPDDIDRFVHSANPSYRIET